MRKAELPERERITLTATRPFNFIGTMHKPWHFPSPDNDYDGKSYWQTLNLQGRIVGLRFDPGKAPNKIDVRYREFDVTDLLPEVRSPTLIFHRRQLPFPTIDAARRLTFQITGSRLVLQEGDFMRGVSGAWEGVAQITEEFLRSRSGCSPFEVGPMAEPQVQYVCAPAPSGKGR